MTQGRRVGVIYQNPLDLKHFKDVLLHDQHVRLTRSSDTWLVEYLNPTLTKGVDVILREVYSFHQVTDIRTACNLAGLVFHSFRYIDGTYNKDTLNYLTSRIRR